VLTFRQEFAHGKVKYEIMISLKEVVKSQRQIYIIWLRRRGSTFHSLDDEVWDIKINKEMKMSL